MEREALKLALEALRGVLDDEPKVLMASISGGLYEVVQCRDAIAAITAALAQPAHSEWNAALDEAASRINEITAFPKTTQDSFAVFIQGLKK